MSVPGRRRAPSTPRASRRRYLGTTLLAAALATGCDVPFEPYEENTVGPYSIFGYLDLKADTQWIRVSPIRQGLLSEPAPIDAVVTLEHMESGRVVTLRDSLFAFADPRVDALGYAHNFWTTEPLEPEATYRLTAVRSDGAATTALVEIPPDFEVSLRFFESIGLDGVSRGFWEPRQMFVQAENLLYTDLIYTVADASIRQGGAPVRIRQSPATIGSGRWGYVLPGVDEPLRMPPFVDRLRREARIATVGSDWPFEAGLSQLDIAIPGIIPSTVENGVGAVQGVATLTIPLPHCYPVEARPGHAEPCAAVFDESSGTVVGRVERDPCSNPVRLPVVRLTERYAGGGAVVWETQADWDGVYYFEGLEPRSNLRLEFSDPAAPTINIPPLGPGDRHVAPVVTVGVGC